MSIGTRIRASFLSSQSSGCRHPTNEPDQTSPRPDHSIHASSKASPQNRSNDSHFMPSRDQDVAFVETAMSFLPSTSMSPTASVFDSRECRLGQGMIILRDRPVRPSKPRNAHRTGNLRNAIFGYSQSPMGTWAGCPSNHSCVT